MLKEIYLLIVKGTFDRDPIEYDTYPTDEQIIEAIKNMDGKLAYVVKGYKLK